MPGFLENGLYAVRVFDGGLATPVPDMGVARWYPTTCTLQDGTTLIAGGSTAEGGGYGSASALNEDTYQVSSHSVLMTNTSLHLRWCSTGADIKLLSKQGSYKVSCKYVALDAIHCSTGVILATTNVASRLKHYRECIM